MSNTHAVCLFRDISSLCGFKFKNTNTSTHTENVGLEQEVEKKEKNIKCILWASGEQRSWCLLLTYLFLDSPPPVMAIGTASRGWGLVVMLFLLLLPVMSGLDVRSALHFFTARGFFHHRTAVLLRTQTSASQTEGKT